MLTLKKKNHLRIRNYNLRYLIEQVYYVLSINISDRSKF